MTDSRSFIKRTVIMAIIVDKVKKRADIALSCKDIFIQKGIHNLTISQIAKEAGVGKGTIYEYFKNKEDIVFEIANIFLQEHTLAKEKKISAVSTTREKIKIFFTFFYTDEYSDLRQIYKEFVSISLNQGSEEIHHFLKTSFDTYHVWFKTILQEGIDQGEIKPCAIDLSKGLLVLGDGLFISNSMTNSHENIEEEITLYLETIFTLIEVKI